MIHFDWNPDACISDVSNWVLNPLQCAIMLTTFFLESSQIKIVHKWLNLNELTFDDLLYCVIANECLSGSCRFQSAFSL